MAELKWIANPYILVTLRGHKLPGVLAASPRHCLFITEAQLYLNLQRKQEIGTWRTSRHKISKTHF